MSKFTDVWKAVPNGETLASYIKRLNISAGLPSKVVDASRSKAVDTSFAGGTPSSLLARQDLETSKTIMVKDLKLNIHKGSEETAKAVFEGCELSEIVGKQEYKGFTIFETPPMKDTDGHLIGCYVVMAHDGSLQVFFSPKDAMDFIDVVCNVSKGQVEDTQKDLISMAQKAKAGADPVAVVENIKAIQLRRQKATIVAREKDGTKKSFKETWGVISKNEETTGTI